MAADKLKNNHIIGRPPAKKSHSFLCRYAFYVAALSFAPFYSLASIENPGFENGWESWTDTDKSGNGTAISDKANNGSKSVKLSKKSTFVSQVVTVQPNTSYSLKAYVLGAGNIGVKVGKDIFFEQSKSNSKKWRPLSVNFNSAEHTAITIFGAFAKKEVRFDDFELSAVKSKEGNKVSARLITTDAGGYGLSPDLPPGRNFDLADWKLNTPADNDNNGISDELSEQDLAKGKTDPLYFYTASDGGMVFKATVAGAKTSKNTRFTRTELREMLRRGDTSIKTKLADASPNKNNWVFDSAPIKAQRAAGGVNGTLNATLAINHVTTTGDAGQVGRVVIGQIHAHKDEPIRLYYRKLPGNVRGSIYAAHEPSGGKDIFVDLLGGRSNSLKDPADGIALNEVFSYQINVRYNKINVEISQDDIIKAEYSFDVANSGYSIAKDYMYFKAGVYNQNNSGSPDDYVKATFYQLENSHDGYKH